MNDIVKGLTEEQREELRNALLEGQREAPKFTIALPSGRPFTGTQEEINEKLAADYQALNQQTSNPPPPPGQQSAQQWNQDEWGQTLAKDGRAGMKMYFERELGFHPKDGFQVVGQALQTIAQRLDRLDRDKFTERHQGVQQEHFDKLNEIVKEKGWALTQESLDDAYFIAKGRGLIQETAPTPAPTPNPSRQNTWNSPPAHIPSGRTGSLGSGDITELDRLASEMDTQELGNFLRSQSVNGGIV